MAKLKSFAQFGKIVKSVLEKNAKNYQQDVGVELGGDVAQLTPIDTGKATANFSGSINAPDTTSKNRFDKSTSANPTKQAIQKELYKSKFGDVLYISNGVKGDQGEGYIIQLENGKSKQAPRGMVAINLARLQIISKEALSK